MKPNSTEPVRWFTRVGESVLSVSIVLLLVLWVGSAGVGIFEAAIRWPVVTAVVACGVATVAAAAWRSSAVRERLPLVGLVWLLLIGLMVLGAALNDVVGHIWDHLPMIG
jgi:hypothetical protein